VRSEFEQQLYNQMNAFISSGASQLFDISCRYDRSLVGAPKEGESASGLHMIHAHYSAQQNIAEKGNGGEFTFAQVMAANATLSVAEFSKVRHTKHCESVGVRLTRCTVLDGHGAFPTAHCGVDRHIPDDEC
jgi:hypothetical protein